MDIKYTKDGKKVVVIGKLNNSESIVQEIHITPDGTEIPAGDNFVASNLLNSPLKTWKEEKIADLEKKYEDALEKWEVELCNKKKKHEASISRLQNKIKHTDFLHDNLSIEPFKTLIDFMENRITHFVRVNYYEYSILDFDAVMHANDNYDKHDIKLLQLFGHKWEKNVKTPASFGFRVSQYVDGSGSDYLVHPATSYENCLSIIENLVREDYIKNGEKLKEKMVTTCEKFKINIFTDSALTAFWKEKSNNFQDQIAKDEQTYLTRKSELELKLKEIQEKIKDENYK